jgi:hypothetical protein
MIVVAVLLENAGLAARLLGLTDFSPMGDEVEVKGVVDFREEQLFQGFVGPLS